MHSISLEHILWGENSLYVLTMRLSSIFLENLIQSHTSFGRSSCFKNFILKYVIKRELKMLLQIICLSFSLMGKPLTPPLLRKISPMSIYLIWLPYRKFHLLGLQTLQTILWPVRSHPFGRPLINANSFEICVMFSWDHSHLFTYFLDQIIKQCIPVSIPFLPAQQSLARPNQVSNITAQSRLHQLFKLQPNSTNHFMGP